MRILGPIHTSESVIPSRAQTKILVTCLSEAPELLGIVPIMQLSLTFAVLKDALLD